MRHSLVKVALVLVALAGSSANAGWGFAGRKASVDTNTLMRLAPVGSSSGLPYATSTLCTDAVFTSLASQATNGFCWTPGSSWSSSAPYALSTVGSPSTVTRSVCPNGPDCGPMSFLKFTGATGNYQATTSVAAASGSFSWIWVGRIESSSGSSTIPIGQFTGTTTTSSFFLSIAGSTGAGNFTTYKTGGVSSAVSLTTTSTPGAEHVYLGAYQFVADGTSKMWLWRDGVQMGTNTTAVGPPNPVTQPITVASNSTGLSNNLTGMSRAAVVLQGYVFSASDVTNLTAALLPQATGFSGTRGEAVSFSRASVATCTAPRDSDGDGSLDMSVLPPGRPCITCLGGQCGMWTEAGDTENLLWTNDLSNAAWTKTSMACVTTTATGPDGAPASTCTSSGANGTVTQSLTLAASARATSVYLKRRTGTGAVSITRDGTTFTALDATNCFLPYTTTGTAINSTSWVRCNVSSSQLNPVIGLKYATSGDALDIQYFNDAAGAGAPTLATTPIPATTASVPRSGQYFSLPIPAGLLQTNGCMRVTLTPVWGGANPSGTFIAIHAGTTNGPPILLSDSGGSANVNANDGTHTPAVVAGWTAANPATFVVSWSAAANDMHVTNVTSGTTGASTAFSGFGAFGTNLTLGGAANGGSLPIGMLISNVVLGSNANGCLR